VSQTSRLRLVVLEVLVLSLLVTLLGRLWYLQVLAGDQYQQAAADNRIREIVTPAVRGQILDSSGRPLVRNRTALVVSVSRTELLKQPDDGRAVLRRLARVIKMPYGEIAKRVRLCGPGVSKPCHSGSPYQPIPVTDRADTKMALQIMERREEFPGVTAELQAVREFPEPAGANAAHMLGYLSPVTEEELAAQEERARRKGTETVVKGTDLVGRSGLERMYDGYLRGRSGVQQLSVDHLGRVTGVVDERDQVPGSYLVTSIDGKVQALAERALRGAIHQARTKGDRNKGGRRYKADSGAVVVLDHQTGRIVAMASYPTYDPSIWVGGISLRDYQSITNEKNNYPNLSRATQGEFAPASTFKVISTSAAAEHGFSLRGTYPCTSSFQVGNREFTNYESQAHGSITFRQALEVSCDTVFYRIGYQMWLRDGGNSPKRKPADPIVTMAKAWGLGSPTGVDLPSESDGRIADRAWKKHYWAATKDENCKRGKTGYPEVANEDPDRARFLEQLARENCADGYKFRAGDAVNFAIGQGDTTVTPLQMAAVYGAVANGGTLWSPRIGKAVIRPDGTLVRELKPKVRAKVPVEKRVLDYIRSALYGVTVEGTGRGPFAGFPLDTHPVASKTGTGEVYGKQTTSWFASFDKRYSIVMMVSQGGTGSGTSGPFVRQIYEGIYGLDGKQAALPGGLPQVRLPTIRKDGTIAAPRGR
jgi:penicillin-binding protein 2